MTPKSLYEALNKQLPGPWQPYEHGALIELGDELGFKVIIEPNGPSWTVASTFAIGYGARRSVKGIEEIPSALGWLVTSFVIGGSTTIRCLPEWLRPTIHQFTLERTKQLEDQLERARVLHILTNTTVPANLVNGVLNATEGQVAGKG